MDCSRGYDTEKKEWDREGGRRQHELFIPNGSKILVGSYTHLRREKLEGYISDFNNMVKDFWATMGDIGIEVLPIVLVDFPGIDSLGGGGSCWLVSGIGYSGWGSRWRGRC